MSSLRSIRSTGNNECNTSLASRSASGIDDIWFVGGPENSQFVFLYFISDTLNSHWMVVSVYVCVIVYILHLFDKCKIDTVESNHDILQTDFVDNRICLLQYGRLSIIIKRK